MHFEHLHLTSAKIASALNDIERKTPFYFAFSCASRCATTRDGLYLQNKTFIVFLLRFSYVSIMSVKTAVANKPANKSLLVFMDRYCLSCYGTRYYV